MVKIQCSNCQMILSLPDSRLEKSYRCEYCKTLVKAPEDIIGTGIVIKDFTILKKSALFSNKTDIFLTHQVSVDRLVMLELLKKNGLLKHPSFFEISQSFACLNHKSISTIFDIGQEEGVIFRSYEYNEGNFIIDLCKKKISQKIAVNIFLDYIEFILYFLKTETGKYYGLLPGKAVITPEYRIKIIPSGLDINTNPKDNTGIFRNITKLFLGMVTSYDSCVESNFLPLLSEKLKEFVLANMNMTDNMFSNIIKGKEKNYFLLYDKLKEEVSDYCW